MLILTFYLIHTAKRLVYPTEANKHDPEVQHTAKKLRAVQLYQRAMRGDGLSSLPFNMCSKEDKKLGFFSAGGKMCSSQFALVFAEDSIVL